MRHYASILGNFFGIIWKAFCLMQNICKNLRANQLKMNGSQAMASIICKNCQHNLYLGSINMSGKKFGECAC